MTPQRLGQNFLASAGWRERIAQSITSPHDPDARGAERSGVWIEIGAGHGEMTPLLARHAEHLIAIEFDARLLPRLREAVAALDNVTVISGDVLQLDLAQLAGGRNFRVYGNLPYYITSPIVHHLFADAGKLEAAFVVVQLEVAERLAASPGVRDYGYLSAFAQFYSRPEILLRIPPGAFRPAPKVDSALVALRTPGRRGGLAIGDEHAFLEFLKRCFAQKRKTLRNNLRMLAEARSLEQIFERARIPLSARAEQLTVEQFASLFAELKDDLRAKAPGKGSIRGKQ